MYCVICVYSSSEVAVHLLNTTTGTLASFVKDGSAENLSVTGHSAEWILESPLAESGDPTILTKFGDVYFDNCIAGDQRSGRTADNPWRQLRVDHHGG